MATFEIIDDQLAEEYITLDEVKNYCRIDLDYSDDDADLEATLISARTRLEQYLNVSLAKREIAVRWHGNYLVLPLTPIGDINGVFKNEETDPLEPSLFTIGGWPKSIVIKSTEHHYNYFYGIDGAVQVSGHCTHNHHNNYYTVNYEVGNHAVLPNLLKQAILAETDYLYKLRGLPVTDNISPNAARLASGFSKNLIL